MPTVNRKNQPAHPLTIQEIADHLGTTYQRIHYAILATRVRPARRLGWTKLYDPTDLPTIGEKVEAITRRAQRLATQGAA
jgi:hypothetical protein